jgi:hypothetical protein
METTDVELEAQRRQIQARLEQLRPEWEALQARLEAITRAQERRLQQPEVRCQIHLVGDVHPQDQQPTLVKVLSDVETNRPVDAVELLEHATRGTALFAPRPGEDRRGEVALLIRGASQRLQALREPVDVQFRAGVFAEPQTKVVLVPILVCLGPEQAPEDLYEAWVNQSPGGLAETLAALAAQHDVELCLYGDGCRLERTFRVPSPLRAFAGAALDVARAGRPLSMDDFHQARAAVYQRHPTVRALWGALKG